MIRTTWFTQQKLRGLYQNKVTSSLSGIQRPGTEQTPAKWSGSRLDGERFAGQCTLIKSRAVHSGQMQCILVKNDVPLQYILTMLLSTHCTRSALSNKKMSRGPSNINSCLFVWFLDVCQASYFLYQFHWRCVKLLVSVQYYMQITGALAVSWKLHPNFIHMPTLFCNLQIDLQIMECKREEKDNKCFYFTIGI